MTDNLYPTERHLTDPLLRELIPQRITPAPGTGRGPTACYLASLAPDVTDDPDHIAPVIALSGVPVTEVAS